MKTSRIGALLCALYALLICACVALTHLPGGALQHEVMVLQLPVAPQAVLIFQLGLAPLFPDLSWGAAYLVLGLPTFVLLYLAGWLCDGRDHAVRLA